MQRFKLELGSGWRLTPPQVLVIGFAAVILTGAVLLSLPLSSTAGKPTPFLNALFTATSAVCVTGLVVVDTATYWSRFGQVVILLLIQVGGLGFMTMSTLAAILLGRRIMLHQRLVIQEALNQISIEGVVRLTRAVIVVTAIIEGTGAVLLTWHWWGLYPPGEAIFQGVFHAISAFCNAGFDLKGEFRSLTGYRTDLLVNLVVTSLIILGGLGFSVLIEFINWPRERYLSLHSRIVVKTTLVLIALGTLLILTIESYNPATLAGRSWFEKLLCSYFQAVTPRTAGFNTIPIADLRPATLFLIVLLMYIGASPGGTGGGIKTTTFVTLILTVLATVRGKSRTEVGNRSLPAGLVPKSLAIAFLSLSLVVGITIALLISEGKDFLLTLFEVTSAFGTVGLSMGLTTELSAVGRALIIALMFAGRVGPLTIAVAVAQRQRENHIRFPEEAIIVG
ncbi:MAG: trk/ktr system potassium uptake protein [Bacillota bacterium]|nr:trk/ktr system potassium uptake protein [Bacillota bacterium]MDK2926644.1 trk/ktr system potassium uptake protein [Bacillota bacterium]